MREVEFEGYWSEKDKEIWKNTDWKARNYEDLYADDTMDPLQLEGHFYNDKGEHWTKPISFVKYIRANPIYPPYFGPIYDSDLLSFMKEGNFCYPCYDGRMHGNYKIHDRFDSSELSDKLSR